MTEPIDLDAVAAKWLQQCGYCDAGIGECAHPEDDYRPVMLSLVREIERLRRELAESRSLIDQMHRAGDHSTLTGAWLQRDTAIEQRDQARAEVERLRVELGYWQSGQRRKGLPRVESVPDGITTAARLARAVGTEGGEEHDDLLVYAAQQLKTACDTAAYLLAEVERYRRVFETAKAWRVRVAGSVLGDHERPLADAVDAAGGVGND